MTRHEIDVFSLSRFIKIEKKPRKDLLDLSSYRHSRVTPFCRHLIYSGGESHFSVVLGCLAVTTNICLYLRQSVEETLMPSVDYFEKLTLSRILITPMVQELPCFYFPCYGAVDDHVRFIVELHLRSISLQITS